MLTCIVQQFSITIFLILGMASIGLGKIGLSDDDELSTINVRDFGAIGDGTTDDSQVVHSPVCKYAIKNIPFV